MIYFSADLHFGHANIIAHTGRPYADVESMDVALVANWNDTVTPRDEVWFLGDFSFHKAARTAEIFAQLNGVKHLVSGNHDDRKTRALPWASVQQLHRLKAEGFTLELCHYPLEVWNGAHHGTIHLHGHSHGTLKRHVARRIDVGIDCSPTLRPFSLLDVVDIAGQDVYEPADHHDTRE